ncbi:hypothetical protein VZT92_010283 [Zoarces viviparus]|uniref:Uncharacterized protein n=1 Tax=Zoarces viviparus TaxID=48416 RepID=A0AAW1FDF9_ZOAVI
MRGGGRGGEGGDAVARQRRRMGGEQRAQKCKRPHRRAFTREPRIYRRVSTEATEATESTAGARSGERVTACCCSRSHDLSIMRRGGCDASAEENDARRKNGV